MNNYECLKSMSPKEMWDTFIDLYENPFRKYIDYEAYLNSTDNDIFNFIKYYEYAIVKPSETELIANQFFTETERDLYVMNHTKRMPILDYIQFYGTDYVVLADLDNNIIKKVPRDNIFVVKGQLKKDRSSSNA